MKLTKTKLKQIIKEEIENVLKEESFQKALSAPGIGDPRIKHFLGKFKEAHKPADKIGLLQSEDTTCEMLAALRASLSPRGPESFWLVSQHDGWHYEVKEAYTKKLKDLKCDYRLNFNPNYMAKARKHAERKAYNKRQEKEGERERQNRFDRESGAWGSEQMYEQKGKNK